MHLLIVSHKRAEINVAFQEEAARWERTNETFSRKGLKLSRHFGLTYYFYNENSIKKCVSEKGLKWNKITAWCERLNVLFSDWPSPVSTAVTQRDERLAFSAAPKPQEVKASLLTSRDSIFSFKVCSVGLREGLVKLLPLCCWNSPNNSSSMAEWKSAKSFHKTISSVMLGRVPLDEMCV